MERTLNMVIVLMVTSPSTFTTLALPSYSIASWSSTGATMRHGAHQVAQKSTTARPLCCSICISKSESFTSTAFDILESPTAGSPAGLRQLVCCGDAAPLIFKLNDPINPAWHPRFPHRHRRRGAPEEHSFFSGRLGFT